MYKSLLTENVFSFQEWYYDSQFITYFVIISLKINLYYLDNANDECK